MDQIANTPEPPYYAVLFTNIRAEDDEGYAEVAARVLEAAFNQPGFLGIESTRKEGGLGITVSYWADLDAVRQWKTQVDHQEAQRLGKKRWYRDYRIRVCKVERDYRLEK